MTLILDLGHVHIDSVLDHTDPTFLLVNRYNNSISLHQPKALSRSQPLNMARREYLLCGGATLEHESLVVVMRGVTCFTIRVQFSRISEARFGKEHLLQFQDDMSRGHRDRDPSQNPTTFLLLRCLPLPEILAPQPSIQGLTVEDLCHCPAYSLELVRIPNTLDV